MMFIILSLLGHIYMYNIYIIIQYLYLYIIIYYIHINIPITRISCSEYRCFSTVRLFGKGLCPSETVRDILFLPFYLESS